MNQKVYDALKRAGRPEAACLAAAKAAGARKPATKKDWREAIAEVNAEPVSE